MPTAARAPRLRRPAFLGAPPQPLDVVMGVGAFPRRSGSRLGAEVAPADVRVQRRAADAESRRCLCCANPRLMALTHIDYPINVDTIIHRR